MESTTPSAPHRDDSHECSDGVIRPVSECHFDCRDNAHSTEEEAYASNMEIVTEILTTEDEWVDQYTTGSGGCDDYATGYAYIVDEMSDDWAERISEWLEDAYYDGSDGYDAWVKDNELSKRIIESICDNLDASSEVECEYDRCDYSAYSGNGTCLWSLEIGEYENQIEIGAHAELQTLHDNGTLDDVLDNVNCDVYVHRSKRREKNKSTGYYENVGRETYHPYGHGSADITCMHVPGGQWHYVIPNDRMRELVTAAIIELCRQGDNYDA